MFSRIGRIKGDYIYNVPMTLLICALFLVGCSGEKQAPETPAGGNTAAPDTSVQIFTSDKSVVSGGDTVMIEYKGSLADGKVFDESPKGAPISFVVGAGSVIPGFEKNVLGMKLNEEKTIVLTPEDGYGPRLEQYVRPIPKAKFPSDLQPEIGKSVNLHTQDGKELPATIIKIDGEMVTLDFNHPLAGKELTFVIKVVGIK